MNCRILELEKNDKKIKSMWHLYLDESGDLGFDFVNKRPSKFFTITIVAVSSIEANRKLHKAVSLTLRRKLNKSKRKKRKVEELKGSSTTLEVKKYFYKQIKDVRFGVYSITLNKKKVYERLTRNKSRVYNYVARKVLDQIPFERNSGDRVEFILDRCMGKPEIEEFNTYIGRQLEGRLSLSVPLDIYHWKSHENKGLQIADMLSWGVFRKYERDDKEWLDIYKDKVLFDELFL